MTSTIVEIIQGFNYELEEKLQTKLTKLRNQYIKVRPIHTSMTSQIPADEDLYVVMAVTVEIGS